MITERRNSAVREARLPYLSADLHPAYLRGLLPSPDASLTFTADRRWRRRIRDHGTLLLITGPFSSVFDFQPVAAAGRLFLLTTPIRLADGP
ncbi:hypothetical protein ACFU7Y_18320 [Kitasatospora sp. NPDC057542]|uniref:hypothetical protein n=1 Tax=Kitasatospora sp. NPDC057542 TaxID=3346162 RepID=UPI00368D0AD0